MNAPQLLPSTSLPALAIAQLARDMACANQLDALARVFVEAVPNFSRIEQGICLLRDSTGDSLLPLTDLRLPTMSMSELENPLVYCLLRRTPCLVDSLNRLINIGAGFDAFREWLGASRALLAIPLSDSRHNALGVLVLAGSLEHLQHWRDDETAQALSDIFAVLFTRLHQQRGVEQSISYERTMRQARDTEASRSRAARLIESNFSGPSGIARQVRREMLMLSESSIAVLITGETGAGKDHAAALIHQASPRGGQFVPVNCAAIPKELIEAELFGSVRGAFTGATQSRSGLVAEANGGTLFLDEIGDMPLPLQGTLLRVLNEKKYRPIGATQEQSSDFRLICATHQPLQQRITEGRFREDLYFRICQSTLQIPALRERVEDIPALAAQILLQFNRERQAHVLGVDPAALEFLQRYPFPGNIRELRSIVMVAAERIEPSQFITLRTLKDLMESRASQRISLPALAHPSSRALETLLHSGNLPVSIEALERWIISERLQRFNGSRTLAAQSLGIPKRTLARKCQIWNLDREPS